MKKELEQRVQNSKNKINNDEETRKYQFKKNTIDFLDKFLKMNETERERTREQERCRIRKNCNEKLNNL